MTQTHIIGQTYDEERALYHLQDAVIENCTFAGPADGESALKEAANIHMDNCCFSLRYPLWHTRCFSLTDCRMDEQTRAAIWYAEKGRLTDCRIEGIKCLRECDDIRLERCRLISPECGWKCRNIKACDCFVEGEYAFFEVADGLFENLDFKGKYSFQYTRDLVIENANLDTKDAFWHSRNVTVKNSVIKGEYLGWYAENLTLINCRIIGTQPLCYCTGLRLENCQMEDTDLSFECSEVEATVAGHILSVKNPSSGHITADSIGEIILDNPVMATDCVINTK